MLVTSDFSRQGAGAARRAGWLAALALTATIWAQPVPDSAPPKAVASGELVVYKHAGGRDLTLEILRPPGWRREDRRPAALFFHGGSWTSGTPAQLAPQGKHFRDRGLVCVLVKYRLLELKGHEPPLVCVQDAKSAMRWVRAHASDLGIDPQRIAAVGASAGGHLAAYLAFGTAMDDPADDLTVSVRPQALLLFNPVLEFGPGEFGHERMPDNWREYSPSLMVAAGAPPAVVLVGSKDKILPVMERFRDAMKAVGARCDLHVYEGQGHSFFNQRKGGNPYYGQTLQAADDFLVSLGWLPPAPIPGGEAPRSP